MSVLMYALFKRIANISSLLHYFRDFPLILVYSLNWFGIIIIVLTYYARFKVLLLDVKCPSLSNEMELIFFSQVIIPLKIELGYERYYFVKSKPVDFKILLLFYSRGKSPRMCGSLI